jgi:hypothetical protein
MRPVFQVMKRENPEQQRYAHQRVSRPEWKRSLKSLQERSLQENVIKTSRIS